jgi:sec-independent protein translocase protein TatC
MGVQMPEWRAETYFSFVTKFMLGMGLGFEMPVVLLALVKIGILDYRKLASFRRYMIVVNLVLGALLTTPEVLTQVLMFVPLQILYEASVWIAWYWERKEKKKAAAALPASR